MQMNLKRVMEWCLASLVILVLASPGWAASLAPAGDAGKLLQESQQALKAGDTAKALERADQAVFSLWQQAPFKVAYWTLQEKPAGGYGIFQPRKDNIYLGSEPIYIYIEPWAYKLAQLGPQVFGLALAMDAYVMDTSGKVLFGKENFLKVAKKSHRRVRQMYINVTLNLTGAPAGKYVIKLVVKDLVGGGQSAIRVPVEFQ